MRTMAVLLLALTACSDPPDVHIAAANAFTRHYSQSRLGKWNVRATAAGTDCDVLLVEASIIMDDSMVDALHRGSGAYDVYTGGVQQFSEQEHFRAVLYRDSSGREWPYGVVPEDRPVAPCF